MYSGEGCQAECVSESVLGEYLSGVLAEDKAVPLEQHLLQCDQCRQLLTKVVDSTPQPFWLSLVGAPRSDGGRSDSTCVTASSTTISQREVTPRLPPGFSPVRRIGLGATGEVWEAIDAILDRPVAVKFLRYANPTMEDLQRLLNEATAQGRLRHPGIVRILEVATREQPAIVMELVRGPSLAEKLNRSAATSRDAATLIAEVADAIAHAHEHGVIHRDLKPSNILLQPRNGQLSATAAALPLADYRPVVSDFGTARLADASGITYQGQLLGTPAYMAPEQTSGDSSSITPAADIYSLGTILYELLTGRPPFIAASAEATLQLVRESDPLAPHILQPQIPADLENICLKCLRRDPADRYASAAALRDDLLRFLEGRPVSVRPVSRVVRLIRWSRRNRLLAASSVLLVLLLTGITLQSLYFAYRSQALLDLSRAAELRSSNLSQQLSQQLSSSVRTMDELVELFGGLDAHDQKISPEARVQFFRKATRFYKDYLAFHTATSGRTSQDIPVVIRIFWLEEIIQPGSGSRDDLNWITEYFNENSKQPESIESLELRNRFEEIRAMHYAAVAKHAEAAASWRAIAEVISKLSSLRQPDAVELNRHYRLKAGILMNAASQYLADQDFTTAAVAVREAIETISKVSGDDPESRVDTLRRIEYSIPLAQLLHADGKVTQAQAAISEALSVCGNTTFDNPGQQSKAGELQQRLLQLRTALR